MSTPKEPNFFSDDDIYAQGWDWYRGLFAGAGERDLLRRVQHALHQVADLSAHGRADADGTCPGMKLIYVMRHPIDRLVSQYIHESIRGEINVPMDQALEQHPGADRLRPLQHATGTLP